MKIASLRISPLKICGLFARAMSRKSSSDHSSDRAAGTEVLRAIVPPLSNADHKGSSGKIAVIGGSLEYTGAPYFAAISALRVGADLAHVFCRPEAAMVIKGYSPELIVHPVLCSDGCLNKLEEWLPKMHAVVLGPGMGRDDDIKKLFGDVLDIILRLELLLVVDADGLFLIRDHFAKIKGYKKCILTPNAMEFKRLEESLMGRSNSLENQEGSSTTDWTAAVRSMSSALDGVSILRKGANDIVSDGTQTLVCSHPGSPRRCGGQGDLLSGVLGTFILWASRSNQPPSSAGYSAALLARECAGMAFEKFGRSMLTSDLIPLIHSALGRLIEH